MCLKKYLMKVSALCKHLSCARQMLGNLSLHIQSGRCSGSASCSIRQADVHSCFVQMLMGCLPSGVSIEFVSSFVLPCMQHALSCAGPSTCFILPVILRDTKTQAKGELGYSGSIRNIDPVMCSHNAIAFYLIMKFTIHGHPWPSLKREDTLGWNNYYLYGGERSQLHVVRLGTSEKASSSLEHIGGSG